MLSKHRCDYGVDVGLASLNVGEMGGVWNVVLTPKQLTYLYSIQLGMFLLSTTKTRASDTPPGRIT